MKLAFWCKLIFVAFCLSAASSHAENASPPPAPAGSPALAKVEAAYQKDLHDKVDAIVDPLEKRLSDVYRASLDSEAQKAIAQGSLDGALAFQTEVKRFAAEKDVPEQDGPGTHAGLARLRAAYRAEAKRLAQQRAVGRQSLLTAYLASLRALEIELTRAAKLDDALAVRKRTTELAALVPPPAAPVATRVTPAAAAATPRPLVFTSALAPLADKVDLYVVGKDAELYVNKKVALKQVTREHPHQVRVSLRVGDVLSVKVAEAFKYHMFWLCGASPAGDFLFETSPAWRAYLPADRISWWELKKATKEQPTEFVPGIDGYVQALMKSASVTPCYRGALPIRSPIDDSGSPYAGNFFYHIVTREDLIPKKIDPATRVDGTAAAQPFLGKSVRLVRAKDPAFGVVIAEPDVKIDSIDAAPAADCVFKIVKGAEPGTVHFESAARAGFFLEDSGNRLHLKKGTFPSSNFWIEKPPSGGDGFLIAGHLHPFHHLVAARNGPLAVVDRYQEEEALFLIQEVPAAK